MRRLRNNREGGVTLVELIITIVIISIALLGVVSVYSRAIERSADPLIYARSVELGQAFLDEIMTKKYDETTPTGGVPAVTTYTAIGDDGVSDRDLFNDVDDYHGKTYTSLEFLTGDNFNQYVNYQVSIAVAFINAGSDPELAGLITNNNNVKRIDVTVTNPLSSSLTFSAYKGNF